MSSGGDGPFRPLGGERPDTPAPAPGPVDVPPAPKPPPGAVSAVTWMLGVLVIAAMAYIALNSIRTEGPGSRGLAVGRALPAFAAPLVDAGGPERDANIAADSSGGRRPACSIRGAGILNVCELSERGPVALVFTADKSARCQEQVDILDGMKARFPSVQFAAVAIRGSRTAMASARRKRRWEMPVGGDRDGAVANAYAVAVCPSITFAREGGSIVSTSLGFASEPEVVRALEAIER